MRSKPLGSIYFINAKCNNKCRFEPLRNHYCIDNSLSPLSRCPIVPHIANTHPHNNPMARSPIQITNTSISILRFFKAAQLKNESLPAVNFHFIDFYVHHSHRIVTEFCRLCVLDLFTSILICCRLYLLLASLPAPSSLVLCFFFFSSALKMIYWSKSHFKCSKSNAFSHFAHKYRNEEMKWKEQSMWVYALWADHVT